MTIVGYEQRIDLTSLWDALKASYNATGQANVGQCVQALLDAMTKAEDQCALQTTATVKALEDKTRQDGHPWKGRRFIKGATRKRVRLDMNERPFIEVVVEYDIGA